MNLNLRRLIVFKIMESQNYNCEFCLNTFKTNSNLINHMKTAKYCLKLRNKDNENFICEYCNKKLSSNYTLRVHKKTCKEKELLYEKQKEDNYKKEINNLKTKLKEQKDEYKKQLKEQKDEYELKIKELQNQIERLATTAINKPTNIQNNNQRINQIINNMTPITDEFLKEQAEFLTLEHLKDGISGYVNYALDYPLKDKIICTDFSRRKVKYKDENGTLIDDPEMIKLSQKLFKAIEEKNDILIEEYSKEIQQKYNILVFQTPNNEMNDTETEMFEAKLNVLTQEFFNAKDRTREIKEIVKGNKNETYYEFIKDVCSKTFK